MQCLAKAYSNGVKELISTGSVFQIGGSKVEFVGQISGNGLALRHNKGGITILFQKRDLTKGQAWLHSGKAFSVDKLFSQGNLGFLGNESAEFGKTTCLRL